MAPCRGPWWVIGSAAVALHLDAPIPVRDVDVLVAMPDDAAAVLIAAGLTPLPGTDDGRFHSVVFGRIAATLPIEIMAGLQVAVPAGEGGVRRAVGLRTHMLLPAGDARIPVPRRDELVAVLRLFGRPKDLARAALLQRPG